MQNVKEKLQYLKVLLKGNGISDKVISAYNRTFSTEDGQIVLEDLAKRFYLFDTLTKNGADRDEILLNEGKRSVVLFILALMKVDMALYEHLLTRGNEV